MHSNVISKNVSGFTLAGPPCSTNGCHTAAQAVNWYIFSQLVVLNF